MTAEFDIEFEEQVMAQCLHDPAYMTQARALLERRSFSAEQLQWMWKIASDVWDKHAELPGPRIFMAIARRDFTDDEEREPYLKTVSKLFKTETIAPQATLDELRIFSRTVALQSALDQSLQYAERGDWTKAWAPIEEVVRQDARPKGYQKARWIEEFDKRQAQRRHRREHPELYTYIPTGMRRLDEIIEGLQPGELGLVLGTTGRGKSIMLNNLGFHASFNGFRGVHFSLEMSLGQVTQRYDSRLTGMLYKKFKTFNFTNKELRRLKRRVDKYRKRFESKLWVVSMPLRSCDINQVRSVVKDAKAEMGGLDYILVDSGDHMQAMSNYRDYRLAQAEVYWDLKDLAEAEQLAVWSSTHAGREWKDKIADAEAVAEAYDKARIADLVMSLNEPRQRSRTTHIIDEGAGNEAKDPEPEVRPGLELFLAKYRDGESRAIIPLDKDFSRMMIREAQQEGGEIGALPAVGSG